jgi:hypothetical protein
MSIFLVLKIPVSDMFAIHIRSVYLKHHRGTITRFACCSVSQAELMVISL